MLSSRAAGNFPLGKGSVARSAAQHSNVDRCFGSKTAQVAPGPPRQQPCIPLALPLPLAWACPLQSSGWSSASRPRWACSAANCSRRWPSRPRDEEHPPDDVRANLRVVIRLSVRLHLVRLLLLPPCPPRPLSRSPLGSRRSRSPTRTGQKGNRARTHEGAVSPEGTSCTGTSKRAREKAADREPRCSQEKQLDQRQRTTTNAQISLQGIRTYNPKM
jgi:hypothetical protein